MSRPAGARPAARTAPPRPVDVEALFPEPATLHRTTVRLHPRRGLPGTRDGFTCPGCPGPPSAHRFDCS